MADPRLRQIKIATGVLKRWTHRRTPPRVPTSLPPLLRHRRRARPAPAFLAFRAAEALAAPLRAAPHIGGGAVRPTSARPSATPARTVRPGLPSPSLATCLFWPLTYAGAQAGRGQAVQREGEGGAGEAHRGHEGRGGAPPPPPAAAAGCGRACPPCRPPLPPHSPQPPAQRDEYDIKKQVRAPHSPAPAATARRAPTPPATPVRGAGRVPYDAAAHEPEAGGRPLQSAAPSRADESGLRRPRRMRRSPRWWRLRRSWRNRASTRRRW